MKFTFVCEIAAVAIVCGSGALATNSSALTDVPLLFNPGPKVEKLEVVRVDKGEATCVLYFSTNTLGMTKFRDENKNEAEHFLNKPLIDSLVWSVLLGTNGVALPNSVSEIHPSKYDPATNKYTICFKVDAPLKEGTLLTLKINTKLREHRYEYARANAACMKNMLVEWLEILNPEHEAVKPEIVSNSIILTKSGKIDPAALKNIPKYVEWLLARDKNVTCTELTNTVNTNLMCRLLAPTDVTVRDWLIGAKLINETKLIKDTNVVFTVKAGSPIFTLETSVKEWESNIVLLLLYHHYQGNLIAIRRNKDATAAAGFLGSAVAQFAYRGRIKGFTEVVKSISIMPREQVKIDYGIGIDTYFYAVRIAFVNENEDDILVYGNSIRIPCELICMEFDSPKEYGKLASVDYKKDLSIVLTNTGCASKSWSYSPWWPRSSFGGPATQEMRDMLPLPKTLVSNGFDQREFKRPKNILLRFLDGSGNVSKALIPVIDKADFSTGVGLAFGVVVPTIQKIWGDATSVQRQTFLWDALDPYTELKRGEELSKVVFLPRFGIDGLVRENTVEYISTIGEIKNTVYVRVALIKSAE